MPLSRRALIAATLAAPLMPTAFAHAATAQTLRLGGQDIAVEIVPGTGEAETKPLIVYCGGAGFTRARYGRWVGEALAAYGDVLLWDYPGQGESTGFPDPFTAEAVVRGLARWAGAQAGDRPVVVWGHSLGGFVGAQLVRHFKADALVLETTAPDPQGALEATGVTVPREYKRLLPLLARYNIPASLKGFRGEVLVLGAKQDKVLPVALSRELAESVTGATYVELDTTHYGALSRAKTKAAVAALLGRL